MTSTLRLKGHRPSVRKGNGHEPTEAEQKLLSALGTSAIYNLPVPTLQPRTSNYPPVYKVDVAVPSLKLAIEADGGSHRQLSRKAEDAKKDALLVSLGWLVLRFSNRQILEDWPTVEATISQCLDLL